MSVSKLLKVNQDRFNTQNKMLGLLQAHGLIIESIIDDDSIHRAKTLAKPKKNNGWYSTFANGTGITYGDWQTGIVKTWHSNGNQSTDHNKLQLKETIERQKIKKNQEQLMVGMEAERKYRASKEVFEHAYLTAKDIYPVKGMKQFRKSLIIPLFDIESENHQIMNIQSIQANGVKRFMKGGKVKGLCFPVGELYSELDSIYITEGVSTAVSVYLKTYSLVLAAMNAGNLMEVALLARKRWPKTKIIIAGDDDWLTQQRTDVNPGVEKAIEAAIAIDGLTYFPPFTDDQKKRNLSDWNDYLNDNKRGRV
jgi:putative DNA primase/helicase